MYFYKDKSHDSLKQLVREIFIARVRDNYQSADRTYLNGKHDSEIEDILDALVSDIKANIDLAADDIQYDIDISEDEEGSEDEEDEE